MADTFPYLTEQWRAEAQRRFETQITPKDMKKASVHLVLEFRNTPDSQNKYVSVLYKKGELQEFALGTDPAPEGTFNIVGNYDIFVQMNKNQLDPKAAVLTGKVKLKGSKIKALQMVGLTKQFMEILSAIPTEY